MIVFRADLSPQSGLFHLRRCAWLASLLQKNNQVMICCREDKKTVKFLAEKKVPATPIKDPGALDIRTATALIFDLPVLSSQDIALLDRAKKAGVKTVQFIAPGGARQAVDLAVHPFVEEENALLHHKFRHFNKAKRKYRKKIRNIFVNLGDLLPYRDLRAVVDTLHRLGYKMKVAPGLNLKKADKRNLMKIYPGSHFCGKSESPARAYFEADLALIPPGEFALEAAAVGTPALYMLQEKGDDALAGTCVGLGIGVKVPALSDWSVEAVRDAIAPLDPEQRQRMGVAGKALVDGLGVERFLSILKEQGIIA